MFKSKNQNKSKVKSTTTIETMIGESTEVTGSMVFSGGLLIEGKVFGNISSAHKDDGDMLILNVGGLIEGDVSVPNVVVNGTVNGDIHVTGRAELAQGAQITGNVYYSLLEMASGAKINGNLVNQESAKEAVHEPVVADKKSSLQLDGNKASST